MTTYDSLIEPITQSIFSAMLNIELMVADDQPPVGSDMLRAMVRITGEWNGRVLLELSPDLARIAAAEMLKLAPEEITDTDQREVVTELVNMIGGNLKSALPGPSSLSLPAIASEEEFAEHLRRAELTEDETLICEHGTLRVRLLAVAE